MTQSKNTKRAFLASVLSIVVCLTMLIGSTFAWFTDTATTGVNKITSGNLDVGLKYSKDFATWNNAEASTEIFDKNALWEPGYTEVVYFEVENKGSLAFNYRIGTNLVNNVKGTNKDGQEIDLTDYIKFGIVPVTAKFADRDAALDAVTNPVNFANLFVAENSLDIKGAKATFAMVVFMPTSVGNVANHNGVSVPSIQFGVQVIATQKAYESDSFNNKYDENSTYPEFAFAQYSEDADTVIKGDGFEVTIPANAGLETSDDHQDVATGTELVVKIDEADSAPNITVEVGDVIIPYTISLETKDGEAVESTDKAITVKMDIGAGRGTVKLYHYTEEVTNATYDSTTGYITFTTNDFSPFTVVEKGAIVADTSWYNETNTEFTLTDAADMFGLAVLVDGGNTFANKTVKLGANIDLEYAEFEAVGDMNNPFSGNFDGQGYTVSNLKITKATTADKYSENRQALISSYKTVGESYIKNLTLNNIDISGGRSVGGLLGVVENADLTTNPLTITNITITGDVQIDCYYAAGALLATGANSIKEISNITVNVSSDSYISNLENGKTNTAMCIGSVGGWVKADVVNNIVSNMNVAGKDGGIGGLFGELMGQTSVAKLSNLNYTGKVTVVQIADGDGDIAEQWGFNKTVILPFSEYFTGLLVGTPRYSVSADKATCKSNGTLEIILVDGTVLNTNKMGTWYEEWAVDLFGASYDYSASGYALKSFSLNYAG